MYVEIIHHGDIGSRLSGPGRLWIVIDTISRPEQIMWLCKSVNYVRLNHDQYNLPEQSVICSMIWL